MKDERIAMNIALRRQQGRKLSLWCRLHLSNSSSCCFQKRCVFSWWWALADLAARFLCGFGISKAPRSTPFASFPSQVCSPHRRGSLCSRIYDVASNIRRGSPT
jgi:hypothetical protein